MSNVPYAQLVDLAEGRLPLEEARALRAQIAEDPALIAELAALEELIGLMRNDDSFNAPEHVINRAVRLMRKPAPPPTPGAIKRIIAVLRAASAPGVLAPGLRSGQNAPRSLSYNAAAWDLDLQVVARAGRWQVRGQLLGPELTAAVELSNSTITISVVTNELGEFSLPPVDSGSYALRISVGTREILVDSLEL